MAESFSVVVACGVFLFAWNSRRFLANNYLLVVGVASLFLGGVDLLHTLAFKGMGVFGGADANLPTQLWLAARYLQALTLLLAPLTLRWPTLRGETVFLGYAFASAVLLDLIFAGLFPAAFVEGVGLTDFKIASEYVISALLLLSLVLLYRRRGHFEADVWRLLVGATLLTVASEMAFTQYASVYDGFNLLGHVFKIAEFYLLYLAIVRTGLTKPYSILLRDLRAQSELLVAERESARESAARAESARRRADGILESITDAFFALDWASRITYVNATAERILGRSRDELVGRPIGDEFTDLDGSTFSGSAFSREARRALTDRVSVAFTEYYRPLGGWYDVRIYPSSDGVSVYFHDVSERMRADAERKQAEAALRDSEQRYRSLFESSPDAALLTAPDGRIFAANQMATQVFGWTEEEMRRLGRPAVIDESDPRFVAAFDKRRRGAGRLQTVVTCRRKDGSTFDGEVTSAVFVDSSGEVRASIFIRDVTERQRAENALRESEERLRLAQQAGRVGVWDWNPRTNESSYTPELELLYGLAPGSAQRYEDWRQRAHPDDYDRTAAERNAAIADHRPFDLEFRIFLPSGDVRWLNTKGAALYDEGGEVVRVLGVNVDITERKLAEKDLKQARAAAENERRRLEAVFEALPVGVAILDDRGRSVQTNAECDRIWGGQRPIPPSVAEYATCKAWWADTGEPVKPEEWAAARAVERGEAVVGQNLQIERFDGTRAFVLNSGVPIFDSDGKTVGSAVSIVDISDRVQAGAERERLLAEVRQSNDDLTVATGAARAAAAAAARQASQMRALLASLGEGASVVDAAGRIVIRNEAARQISGISDEQLQNSLYERRIPYLSLEGQQIPFDDSPVGRALRGEQFTDHEAIILRPDGSRRRVLFSGAGVRDEAGADTLGLVVFRDVTELRDLERAREEYLRAVTHDVRNPLTSVLGVAQLIQRYPDRTELVRRNAELLEQSARRMNRMLGELVESIQIESDQLSLHPLPVDLTSLAFSLRDQMEGVDDDRRQRVRVECLEALPPVKADPESLERILMNLISNALKYSEPDTEVVVEIARRGDEAEVAVRDHGQGILPEYLPRLFERYYREERAGQHREGLGLGLYITKGMVEANGGRIWVESEVGRGSTFCFTLPLSDQEPVT